MEEKGNSPVVEGLNLAETHRLEKQWYRRAWLPNRKCPIR